MAECCLPFKFHDGTPTGKYEKIFGLDSYVAGDKSSKKVLVLLSDIYGYNFKNLQIVADAFGKAGYYTVVPDILGGEVASPDWPGEKIMAWVGARGPEVTGPLVKGYVTKLREELKPSFLGSVGYCFGARYTNYELTKDGLFDAGCIAHPSLSAAADYEAIAKPLLVSAAEHDQMFPVELRHAAEAAVLANNVPFQSTVFGQTAHGFTVKGDYSVEAVRYAGEKSFRDQLEWFERFSS